MPAESPATSQPGPILIGIDERPSAQDALALGRWLSGAQGAELLLAWVHPYDRLPSLLDDSEHSARVRESIDSLMAAVRSTLPEDLRPALRLLSGRSPAHALQQLAEREGAAAIVLGASERSGLGRIAPGRTATRLLSGSRVPVAVAPRGYAPPGGDSPLIGVGFDAGDEARRALAWAADFAGRAGGRLRVIAAHEPVAFGGVGVGAVPTESVSQALYRELQSETEAAVGRLEGLSAEARLVDGDPVACLAAESEELDLLVLGSRGYGPLLSVLVGSVSEATIAAARSPVLVVPRGEDS